ncbi:ATPase domain-containing protein [Coraliomargarita algicola]|uniref:ATPase domain-containing protein n=1 Tax=Coraliomargarita algicola TaxID=3092156 RepID=A0ABZ0RFN9_9BACT|nr:ATPase domain-containing protein [Coraliomargarita sp. J2-16]WPJ94377.1 ATPase domain-containing protein [Coraliomargarita sp. J2-16]
MKINCHTNPRHCAQPESDHLPTGIPQLDAAMEGGIPRGRLTVFAAYMGVGKTMALCNFSGTMLTEGHQGVFMSYRSGNLVSSYLSAFLPSTSHGDHDRRELDAQGCKKLCHIDWLYRPKKLPLLESLRYEIDQVDLDQVDFLMIDEINDDATEARRCDYIDREAKYRATAEFLDAFARETGIAVVAAISSNKSALFHKYNCPYYTCSSKQFSRSAKYFIGMSSLREIDEDNSPAGYLKNQFLSVHYGDTLKLKQHVPVVRW